ncbi:MULTISPECIES: flavin reductase family protein [unclassified Burkholderia]|uniref:flavin reductase family protein n=1 Tax=unclassified Burkholderia TaxID=2613784 RepID=UPI000F574A56|nr:MULTISPECIES: flavin reductase family protein [unclassified Burkholderia]RQS26826.1 flavin reductase [Burkholderia sp. Bp8995]RQS51712.1 flavin reductase [Burkholderia sp. Bp8989]
MTQQLSHAANATIARQELESAQVQQELCQAFKLAMRRLTSTIAIISTEQDGQPFGMVATAVSSLCVDPPALLICVNRNASISRPLIQRGEFVVNLLRDEHRDLVGLFSGKLKGAERFQHGHWDHNEGMPVLADAQAAIVCEVDSQIHYGGHDVIVGRVTRVRVEEAIAPLLYQDGKLAISRFLDQQAA